MKTSKKIGYTVPIKTTERKYIINQLLIKTALSLLIKKKPFDVFFSSSVNKKNIIIAKTIKKNKKTKTNNPLEGSFAKV